MNVQYGVQYGALRLICEYITIFLKKRLSLYKNNYIIMDKLIIILIMKKIQLSPSCYLSYIYLYSYNSDSFYTIGRH